MLHEVLVNARLGEEIRVARLDNGLPVYVLPKRGYNKKYATFAVKYGSIDSKFRTPGGGTVEVPDGIAHFLEHKLFEQEEGNVFDEFAGLGASANAYTTYTTTTYLFSATENFYENLRVLLRFVQDPYFTSENVEKEKGIIEQEIRMYEDMPEVKVGSNLMRALYSAHPVRVDVVGTVESIRQITTDMLYRCYETFYRPENMAVLVVGDVEPSRVFDEVAAGAGFGGRTGGAEIERIFPEEPEDVADARVVEEMVVATPLLEIGFKDDPQGLRGTDLLRREVMARVLLEAVFGKSSDLYSSLYEQGLIDDKFGATHESELEYAASFAGGESKDPDRLHALMMDHIEGVRKRGLETGAIERAIRKMGGEFVTLLNSPERMAYRFNAYLFKGINLFDYINALQRLTPGMVQSRLEEHLAGSKHAVSIIRPKSR
ncbi:MAG: EF-P 5-aminopentanol modification-associated protein YfmH [Ignavibacteriales bacterium]